MCKGNICRRRRFPVCAKQGHGKKNKPPHVHEFLTDTGLALQDQAEIREQTGMTIFRMTCESTLAF